MVYRFGAHSTNAIVPCLWWALWDVTPSITKQSERQNTSQILFTCSHHTYDDVCMFIWDSINEACPPVSWSSPYPWPWSCPNDIRCTETDLSLISMPMPSHFDGFMTVWLVNKNSNYIILIYNLGRTFPHFKPHIYLYHWLYMVVLSDYINILLYTNNIYTYIYIYLICYYFLLLILQILLLLTITKYYTTTIFFCGFRSNVQQFLQASFELVCPLLWSVCAGQA